MYRFALTAVCVLFAGCNGSTLNTELAPPVAVDLGEWTDANADLSCSESTDCLSGESCVQGLCLINRCDFEGSPAAPPMGAGLVFLQEDEVAVAGEGDTFLEAYSPQAGHHFTAPTGGNIRDIAGGNFHGERNETYAAITSGSNEVELVGVGTMALPIAPIAVAGGDTDGDGLDEIVVAGTAQVAICHWDTQECEVWDFFDGGIFVDITVGDIDGDNIEEPVLIEDRNGVNWLFGFNTNQGVNTGNWESEIGSINPYRVTSADTDGDGVAEVLTLWDPWFCPFDICDDEIHVADAVNGEFIERYYVDVDGETEALDLEASDTDADERAEVMVLGADGRLSEMGLGSDVLVVRGTQHLNAFSPPTRLATADHDGDSPRALLNQGPQRVEGNVVPMVLLALPPYDAAFSDGRSRVAYGNGLEQAASNEESVSLDLGVDVGTQPSFFGIFGARLSAKVNQGVKRSEGTWSEVFVRSRYTLDADPETFGPDYAGVVVGWGCFDAYEYIIDDPYDRLGGAHGEAIVLTVPVSGGEALYSSNRYNAMADILGTPRVSLNYQVGNPDSYPSMPVDLQGNPVPPEATLFPNAPTYDVSDVGSVTFVSSLAEGTSIGGATDLSVGASAGVTAYGVSVGVNSTVGWAESYSVKVGDLTEFRGSVPALPDSLNTPEDEFNEHRYRFTPYIYSEPYTDFAGTPSSYYVINYAVER